MDEFLDKILWEDDTTFVPLIISIEAVIQLIAVILMFCFAFGPNAPDGEWIDFLKAHKYIPTSSPCPAQISGSIRRH